MTPAHALALIPLQRRRGTQDTARPSQVKKGDLDLGSTGISGGHRQAVPVALHQMPKQSWSPPQRRAMDGRGEAEVKKGCPDIRLSHS